MQHGSWQRFMQPARGMGTQRAARTGNGQRRMEIRMSISCCTLWVGTVFFFWFVRKTSAFAAVAPADVVVVVPVRFVVVSPCCCFSCGALNAENHVA